MKDDLGKFEPNWGSQFKPWEESEKKVQLFTTNSADGKPVQTISQIRNGAHL